MKKQPGRLDINMQQLNELLNRIEQQALTEADYPLIMDLIRSMVWLSQTLEEQQITIHRLRKLFGFKSECTKDMPKPDDKGLAGNTENSSNTELDPKPDDNGLAGNTENSSDTELDPKPDDYDLADNTENSGDTELDPKSDGNDLADTTENSGGGDTDKSSHDSPLGDGSNSETGILPSNQDGGSSEVGKNEEAGEPAASSDGDTNDPKKREGNKFSVSDYKSAIIIQIGHEKLKSGNRCPECHNGNLYLLDPGVFLRIVGQPWLQPYVYERERLRCNTCGQVFTAKLPADVANASKFDQSAKAIVSLLKYRGGFPFYRQESLQAMLNTPVSDSVLWGMTRDVALCLEPVFEVLIAEAAKGECLHNDDTKARILTLIKENKTLKEGKDRTGIFTSAILSKLPGYQVALFFTGRQHAGENLDDVLDRRPQGACTPTQMCDASNNNSPKRNQTDESNCHAHLRRKFYEIAEIWPTYVLPIIQYINSLFRHARIAKEEKLTEAQTLAMHQEKSTPIIDKLKSYCTGLIDERKTEPNSNLGKAIKYMMNHWEAFTLFLRKAGVPLDNNDDERLMKRPVLNRKNGLFFKTEFGAYVGDILMSVIETCQLNKINPFHYLVSIQKYQEQVATNPQEWLPWNYQLAIDMLDMRALVR